MYLDEYLKEKKSEAKKNRKLYRHLDFAEDLCVSVTTVSNLIHGRYLPSRSLAKLIEKMTGGKVTYDDFLRQKSERSLTNKPDENVVGG